MAKINPIKTRQEAEKAEKAGKPEQAIPLFRQLLEDNPRDWNTINKIGDLFAKIGKMREAGDEYAKVADFYSRDGFHLKAIAIWKKINKLDPSVIEPYAKLADLYAKQGLVMEAKSQYQVVSEDQLKRGRFREATDTLRKMVEIDSSDLKTRSRLADIYTKEGSTGKAVGEYIAISEELNLKGHPAEAIQVLEKGLKIDNGITVKAQLGRVHLAQRSYEKAIAYLEEVTAQDSTPGGLMQLGQAYLGAKRVIDAQSTLENVLEKFPESQDARIILVQIYAVQGRADEAYDTVLPLVEQLLLKRDGERASNMLLQITARSPQHVRTLQKLVEVARIRQNERAIVKALNQLLEAHLAGGSDRAAEDTAAQLVEAEPDNEQFKSRLEALRKKKAAPVLSGPAKVAVTAITATAEVALPPPAAAAGASDLEGLEFDTGAVVRPKGMSADSNTDREFIEEHLAESRVFRKYGLLDKAEEQVDLVLVRFPNIFDARFEKKEIFKETERIEEAAKECVWLAGVARKDGNDSLAQDLSEEAEALRPGISQSAAPEFVAETPVLEVETIRVSEGISLDAVDETSAPALESAPLETHVEEEEEELSLEVGIDEGEPADPGGAEAAPPAPSPDEAPLSQAAEAPAEMALGAPQMSSFSKEIDRGPDLQLASGAIGRRTAAPAQVAEPEVARVVEEVDSYVALGFLDDAKDALRDGLGRFPGDPFLLERASSLGLDLSEKDETPAPTHTASPALAPEPPADENDLLKGLSFGDLPAPPRPSETGLPVNMRVAAAAPLADEGGIDLGAELSALFDAQPALQEVSGDASRSSSFEDQSLQDVFDAFKKGVDSQLGEGDFDTRYNLGIAYKEMGLIDEAIAEFQLAAKDPKRSLECSSMIGICFMEKGMADVAVQWYEKGLQVQGRDPEEYRGLRYDLGMAWEAAGELTKAKATFSDLVREDPSFRDASDKLRALQSRV